MVDSNKRKHASPARRLAAILFADIVGYTSLMQSDEALTLQIIKRYQSILDSAAQEFNGQVLKNYGDGSLMTFGNSVDAVKAARQIQTQAKADPALPYPTLDVPLRIGIHVGEFVVEKGDIYGNGVNLASRIESLGIKGAVLFSKNVYQKIKNQPEFEVKSLGHFDFKNVEEPMEVFALANEGFPVPKREEMQGKLKHVEKKSGMLKWMASAALVAVSAFAIWFFPGQNQIVQPVNENSIAVLPFVNMSNDAEQEYFSDGISEEIINKLAQIHALKVTGRTSSFSFRGKDLDLQEIGKKLKVSHILEGSVRKSGNTLRITAQLIKVSDGFHLYSNNFDREIEDIFSIQDEISLSILDAIKLELLGEEKEAVLKKYTDNIEAYQLYLKARYHYNQSTPEAMTKAIGYLKEAIKMEPEYAIAYSALSFCHMLSSFNRWLPREQGLPQMLQAANQAIKLDDQIAESYLAKGRVKLWYEYKLKDAQTEFKKALAINPNSTECHMQLAWSATLLGNHAEAQQHAKIADNLDPFSLLNLASLCLIHYMVGDLDQLEQCAKRIIDIVPNTSLGHTMLGLFYLASERYEEALRSYEMTAKLNYDVWAMQHLVCTYARMGEISKAREIIEEMRNLEGIEKNGSNHLGNVYIYIGELDTAFQYYDKAIDNREQNMLLAKYLLRDFGLLEDPRTKAMLDKMGVP